jgi:DNA invertase Pin-like site-specific DNA recombinase
MRMTERLIAVNEQGRRIGEDHPNARLTDYEVSLVLEMRELCMSYGEIARKFEVHKSTVRDICKGRRRGQRPFRWKRADVVAS